MLQKGAAREALQTVSREFPDIKSLPSERAVRNYRSKYLGSDLEKVNRKFRKDKMSVEKEKLKLEQSFGKAISELINGIIPTMVSNLKKGVDRENSVGIPFDGNNKRLNAIVGFMKEANVFFDRNGLKAFKFEVENETGAKVEGGVSDEIYEKLARALQNSDRFNIKNKSLASTPKH